ncbi:flagellar assembly protein FliW [Aliarcobacter skirrowii]|uniref:Flagellar biosynthesis protein FliW n=1 Tax=Aliarcobacter skirrowii TaxID=28200 RepID=A0A2U2C1K6_9BACT|nr:flagellar assembly protein FliW [Aliarcobacter skirrowii]MDX3959598.1 flagellar assembly protein FliW [Aliarcobacter skirrowii]MDX4012091.1 flagellar assembly protein FliW [Aliarcobacter skirrowii]MDX4025308.1 flagellar assembly protein FliW [Aliarcobacter skirrowii]MDX4034903.1 flagellar assembly protein FliW [Aliarcobacter skirrowii]MDX4037446.1 flagellar assembly protein FliW [Aliarcobacter skirrowii]
MYKIVLPILGFENNEKLDIEKIDEHFSYLKLEDGSKISIVNINILSRVSFDFEIDQVSLDKLKIKTKDDFSTYFVLVSQNPVEHSIINLVAPIFVNEKERLVGQYITSEKVEPYLASLNKCINL